MFCKLGVITCYYMKQKPDSVPSFVVSGLTCVILGFHKLKSFYLHAPLPFVTPRYRCSAVAQVISAIVCHLPPLKKALVSTSKQQNHNRSLRFP